MRSWPLFLVALVGCSGGSSTPPTTSSAEDSATGTVDDAAEEVATEEDTAVPCGNKVGDVLCDLDLEGYVRDGVATGLATTEPYAAAKLSEVLARGTQKYALIWTSAYW